MTLKVRRARLVARWRGSSRAKAGMIHSVTISGYRGFSRFDMSQLGRVNLLVGKNNSGKTSVLEALYLLAADGDPFALWRILARRGERIETESSGRAQPDTELDISHLFCGHEFKLGAHIHLATRNGSPDRTLNYKLVERKGDNNLPPQEQEAIEEGEHLIGQRMALEVTGSPKPIVAFIPLTRFGGIRSEVLDGSRRVRGGRRSVSPQPAQYISTESLSVQELASMWNEIVLTDSEELVLSALRFLEPKIDRIAAVTGPNYYYFAAGARGGFKIKLRGTNQPVPIGSLGDGIWRMLAMAIAIIRSKGGVLLVDEIDTGLHYSVMSDMWRLIANTARDYGVQVFATTHSFDCVQSLATICHPLSNEESRISIQRIEMGKRTSIPFTENEVRIAADRQIEIR